MPSADYFNPDNPTHSKIASAAETILEEEESPLNTPTLADKIAGETGTSPSTVRSLLYYAREYIQNNHSVTTRTSHDNTPGSETWIWELDEESHSD